MTRHARLFLTLWLASIVSLRADFSIRVDEPTQRYTILDGDAPVLTYNFGTVPVPAGVGGIYAVARGDYVHPLYGPHGEMLTMDYSPDHPHHRGIYWAWPEVTYQGQTRDLHALQGVFARPVKIVRQDAGPHQAELEAENVWKWGDQEPIVNEHAAIRVHPVENGVRLIEFDFRFVALKPGVTLARRHQDAYGGFNVRLSHRDSQQIEKNTADTGYPYRAAWAELRGIPPGGKEPVGVLILQHPQNPEYPGDWVDYPNLNWLQPTFPSKGHAYPLQPGKPLNLSFCIAVRSGPGLAVAPETLLATCAKGLPEPLAGLQTYTDGHDRRALTALENATRALPAADRRRFETDLLEAIRQPDATDDFERWACKQLLVNGSDACVTATAPLLRNDAVWMQAADVLLARPGDVGLAALRDILPALPPARRAALCGVLGFSRDAQAVSLLVRLADGAEPEVVAAAAEALGAIATHDAADALGKLTVPQSVHTALCDARLAAATRLTSHGSKPEAAALCRLVLDDPAATPWHRGAAVKGLAIADPAASRELLAKALTDGNSHVRHGAAAALSSLDAPSLTTLRGVYTQAAPDVRAALLEAWAAHNVRAAEPEALAALTGDDDALRLAAMNALRRVGSAAAVPPLLTAVVAGGERGAIAESVLCQLHGTAIATALAAAAGAENEDHAAAAVKVLAARRDAGYLGAMAAAVDSARPACVRAALPALRNDGGADQLSPLRQALRAETAPDRDGIAKAIVAICKRADDPNGCLDGFLRADPPLEGAARDALVGALPGLGGAMALAYVTATTNEATVRALLNWPDEDGVAPLMTIVERPGLPPRLRTLAAGGLVQLARRVLPQSRRLAAFRRVLPALPDEAARTALENEIAEGANANLALKAVATCDLPHESGHPPEHAVDGNRTTASYWGCATSPAALTVDLGHIEEIGLIRVITYWGGGRYYQYRVDVSPDAKTWTCVADMSANTTVATEAGITHRFSPREARYIRVTMLKNSLNPGMHIVELQAFAPVIPAGKEVSK